MYKYNSWGDRNENKLPLARSYSSPPGNGRRPNVKNHLKVPKVFSQLQDTTSKKMHKTRVVSMGTKGKIGSGDNNHITYYPNRKYSDSWIGSSDSELGTSPKPFSMMESLIEKADKETIAKSPPSNNSFISNNYLKKPKLTLKKLDLDKKFSSRGSKSNTYKNKDQNNNNNTAATDTRKQLESEPSISGQQNKHSRLQETVIREMIQNFFTKYLEGVEYNHGKNEERSINLSQKIHDYLKQMTDGAFKFIVSVFMGEIREDGMETSSQCVWDPKQDCVVMGYYRNDSLFAIAVVFAIALD